MKEFHPENIKNPSEIYQEITTAINRDTQKLAYEIDQEEKIEVRIEIDNSLSPGRFKPSQVHPGLYYAHKVTIKAMRKDLFVTDTDLLDYQQLYTCGGCKTTIDLQFWNFCPHCETRPLL